MLRGETPLYFCSGCKVGNHNSNTPSLHSQLSLHSPGSFPAAQVAIHSVPNQQHCIGPLWPTCRTQHLVSLNLIQLASAQRSTRPKTRRVFLLSKQFNTSSQLGVIHKLTGSALNPLIQITNKVLNSVSF